MDTLLCRNSLDLVITHHEQEGSQPEAGSALFDNRYQDREADQVAGKRDATGLSHAPHMSHQQLGRSTKLGEA